MGYIRRRKDTVNERGNQKKIYINQQSIFNKIFFTGTGNFLLVKTYKVFVALMHCHMSLLTCISIIMTQKEHIIHFQVFFLRLEWTLFWLERVQHARCFFNQHKRRSIQHFFSVKVWKQLNYDANQEKSPV